MHPMNLEVPGVALPRSGSIKENRVNRKLRGSRFTRSALRWRTKIVLTVAVALAGGILILTQGRASDLNVRKGIKVDKRLLDLTNFVISADEAICQRKKNTNKFLLIGIHSSRNNYRRRNAIRNTWGTIKEYKGWQISLAFLLGSSAKNENTIQGYFAEGTDQVPTDSGRAKNESAFYKDLVVGNFVDSYRNLTYKHMMGFKWVLDSCSEVDAYIKTDDDVFVNIYKTIDWLSSNKLADHFYCYVLQGYSPWRSKRYKFYISKDEYKPKKFPDYCSGVGYITRPSLLKKLYQISLKLPYLWVDDLFSTGLLTKYFNDNAARQADTNSWDSDDDSTLNVPARIHFRDRSAVYLNEQYAVYKRWIDDSSQRMNPWEFILLKKKNEHDLVVDQETLWHKTSLAYKIDNIH